MILDDCTPAGDTRYFFPCAWIVIFESELDATFGLSSQREVLAPQFGCNVDEICMALVCAVFMVTDGFAGEAAKPIYPAGIKPIAPYSPAIMYGDLLFISGQIPYVKGAIPENARDGVDDIKDQTAIVMGNLKTVLAEAGMSFKNVLKATVFITDLSLYGDFNKVYGPYWTKQGLTPPARATVEVGALPGSKPGAPVLVEISMIAGK